MPVFAPQTPIPFPRRYLPPSRYLHRPTCVAAQLCLLALLVTLRPAPAQAQLTNFDRARIVAEVTAAAGAVDPDRFPDLGPAIAETGQRIGAVKSFLQRRTDPDNARRWLKFLELDPLAESLANDESPSAIGRAAIDLQSRLIGTARGLEMRVLRELRRSVEELIEAIRYRDKSRSAESLSSVLESLADRFKEFDDRPTASDTAVISTVLSRLDSSGQSPGAVATLRSVFGKPNLAILVGEPIVQTAVSQNVDQTRPVRDCILGTRIIGTADMDGFVSADLLPSIGAARLQVSLTGRVVSNSYGYNGPVRLRTVGYGDVIASRAMSVNESGVNLEPTHVRAKLRTEIKAIEHPLRIVRRIARRRAAEQKPQADRIATQHMQDQIGQQFASQTSEAVSIEMPDFLSTVTPILQRLSLEDPARFWGSTDRELSIDLMLRKENQLGSVAARPPIAGSFDAAVQIHESAVDNAVTPFLAGRTIKQGELAELMAQSGIEFPLAASSEVAGDGEEPDRSFEIDFAQNRPIIFEARDQTIRIGVRGTRFAEGRREIDQPRGMEISAVYLPATTAEGHVILIRDGGVDVNFGRRRLTVSQTALRRAIQRKFQRVFPESLLYRPLEVPQTVQLEALRGRVFHPRYVDARNGWLTIAVR